MFLIDISSNLFPIIIIIINNYFSPFTLLTSTHKAILRPRGGLVTFQLICWSKRRKGEERGIPHREFVGAWNRCAPRICSTYMLHVSLRGNEPSTALYLFPFVARTFRFAIDEKRLVKGFEKYTADTCRQKDVLFDSKKRGRPPHCVGSRTPGDARALERVGYAVSKGCTRIGL